MTGYWIYSFPQHFISDLENGSWLTLDWRTKKVANAQLETNYGNEGKTPCNTNDGGAIIFETIPFLIMQKKHWCAEESNWSNENFRIDGLIPKNCISSIVTRCYWTFQQVEREIFNREDSFLKYQTFLSIGLYEQLPIRCFGTATSWY
jgi:hypothetical protein